MDLRKMIVRKAFNEKDKTHPLSKIFWSAAHYDFIVFFIRVLTMIVLFCTVAAAHFKKASLGCGNIMRWAEPLQPRFICLQYSLKFLQLGLFITYFDRQGCRKADWNLEHNRNSSWINLFFQLIFHLQRFYFAHINITLCNDSKRD